MLAKSFFFCSIVLYTLAVSAISIPRRAIDLVSDRVQRNQFKFRPSPAGLVKRDQFNPRANVRVLARRAGPSAECSAVKPCVDPSKTCVDGQCVTACTDPNGVQASTGGCVPNSCRNSSFFFSPVLQVCVDACVGLGNTQNNLGGCLSCRADSVLIGTGAQCSVCLGSTIPNLAGTLCINACAILRVGLLELIGIQDRVNGGCSSCPAFSLGETYVNSAGQCAYCPLGQTYSSTTQGCVTKCTNGITGPSGGCSTCGNGYVLAGSGPTATCVARCNDANGVQSPTGGCIQGSCKSNSFFYSPVLQICVDACVGVGNTQNNLGGCLSCRADSVLSGTGAQCSVCLGSTIPNLSGNLCIKTCAVVKVGLLELIGIQDRVNGGCSSCPLFSLGETYVNSAGQCSYCPLGQTYSSTTQSCVTKCTNGVTGPSGGCSSCISGYSVYGQGSTSTCVLSCPNGILSVPGNTLSPNGRCLIAAGNQCGGGTNPLSYLGSTCAGNKVCLRPSFGATILRCL